MIECICINDENRPKEIPPEKWVKKGEPYHITYVVRCLPQKVLGFSIYELPLVDCMPYEYFLSYRFGMKKSSIVQLIALMQELDEMAGLNIEKLVEESELQTV